MYELMTKNKLTTSPTQYEEMTAYSIVFLGARYDWESDIPLDKLFNAIVALFFPALQRLNITMIGPDLDKQASTTKLLDGKVQVRNIPTKIVENDRNFQQTMFPIDQSLAIIFQPGLSQLTPSWKPVITRLRNWNVLTIVTSYSFEGYFTFDCLHDGDILNNYFACKLIIPHTLNPFRLIDPSRGISKGAYYLVFQGEDTSRDYPTWTEEEFTYNTRVSFMTYLVTVFTIEGNPTDSQACEKFLEDFKNGKVNVPNTVTLREMESMALSYRRRN